MIRKAGLCLAIFVVLAGLSANVRATEAETCGDSYPITESYEEKLRSFARQIGLNRIRAFLGTVSSIIETGFAPPCYLRKDEAKARGWDQGDDLCDIDSGIAIGAYPYENREGLLPRKYEGSYRIADLDYACGKRNARRLIYVEGLPGEWLIWVTMDHYKSYTKVPAP